MFIAKIFIAGFLLQGIKKGVLCLLDGLLNINITLRMKNS